MNHSWQQHRASPWYSSCSNCGARRQMVRVANRVFHRYLDAKGRESGFAPRCEPQKEFVATATNRV